MKVIIYSKEGCQYCDHAVTLSEAEGLEYEKILIEKEELKNLQENTNNEDKLREILAEANKELI